MLQFKKVVSFVLVLAMILSSVAFVFADGPEVNPQYFDSTTVTRSIIFSTIGKSASGYTNIMISGTDLAEKKLLYATTEVPLAENGVYTITGKKSGKTDTIDTFTFHLKLETSITAKADPELAYWSGKTISNQDIWDAVVASVSHDVVTSSAVTIQYLAKAGDWRNIGSTSTGSGRHLFGAQATETVKITFNGDDTHKACSVEATVTLVDPRIDTSITAKEGEMILPYWSGKTISNQEIWDAVVASVSHDVITLSAVTIKYLANPPYRDTNDSAWQPLNSTSTSSGRHVFGTQTTEELKIVFNGDDTHKACSVEAIVKLVDPRSDAEILLTPEAISIYFYSGMTKEDVEAAIFDALGDNLAVSPEAIEAELVYEYLANESRDAWHSVDYEVDYLAALAGSHEFGKNKSEKIRLSFAGNDSYKPVGITSEVTVTLLECEKPEITVKNNQTFNFYVGREMTDAAYEELVALIVGASTPAGITASAFTIEYNGRDIGQNWCNVKTGPQNFLDHNFGIQVGLDLQQHLRDTETLRVKFLGGEYGGTIYAPATTNVTLKLEDQRKEYEIEPNEVINFNYYDGYDISAENLSAEEEKVFNAIVKTITPSGITASAVKIRYMADLIGLTFEKLSYDSKTGVGHDFGEAYDGKETVRIEIDGNDTYKPFSKTYTVNIVDNREQAILTPYENAEMNYFYGNEIPVTSGAIFASVIDAANSTPASVSVEDIKVEYKNASGRYVVLTSEGALSPFGKNESVDLKITYLSNENYKSYVLETQLALKDPRIKTSFKLKYNYSKELLRGLGEGIIPDIVIVYNSDESKMKADIASQLGIVETDRTYRSVSFTNDELTLDLNGIDSNLLKLQKIEISYNGTQKYSDCTKTFDVYILPTTAQLKVNSQTVVYGKDIDEAALITSTPADLDYVWVISGVDTDIQGFVSLQFPASVREKMNFSIPGTMISIDLYEILQDSIGSGVGIGEFAEIVSGIMELINAIPEEYQSNIPFNASILKSIADLIAGLGNAVEIRLGEAPSDAGLYLVNAFSTDPNYIAMAVGNITILQKFTGVELKWNQDMRRDGLLANNQLYIDQAEAFNWGGYLEITENETTRASIKNVTVGYAGLTRDGKSVLSSKAPTLPGIYDETVSLIGGNYITTPITRTYTINRYPTVINTTNVSVIYDGQPHTVEYAAVSHGDDLSADVNALYAGTGYLSTVAPSQAGIYLVTLSYAGDLTHDDKIATAYLTIKNADPVITVEDKTVEYTKTTPTPGAASVALVNDEVYTGNIYYRIYKDSDCKIITVPVDAGTYYVKAFITPFKNYNAAVSDVATLEITKTALSVEIDSKNAYVGGSIPEFTYTASGLCSGDAIILTCGAIDMRTATEVAIEIENYEELSKNYNIAVTGASLKISYIAMTPVYSVSVSGDETSIGTTATVDGNTARINPISDEQLNKVISSDVKTGVVNIDVSKLPGNIDTVDIKTDTVKKISAAVEDNENDALGMSVNFKSGKVSFDAAATESIAAQAEGNDIILKLKEAPGNLTAEQSAAAKELNVALVLDVYLECNGKRIAQFDGGNATIEIPYTLKSGQDASALQVWYIANDGSVTAVSARYINNNIVFTAEHFSHYAVSFGDACQRNENCPMFGYNDLDLHAWYHDGVHFCLENKIMVGTEVDEFEPDASLSRAMIVTMLWNMAGQPKVSDDIPYPDVEEGQWYSEAVRWATAEKVAYGYDDGLFYPENDVTREELACFLYNYAKHEDKGFEGDWMFLLSFTDADEVSEWAFESVLWNQANGVIHGDDDGSFRPQDNATRAEAATMMMFFCGALNK